MGESGHGKTSLLNSLINHTDTDILPTSGSTACTAVVIEVGDNGAQPVYEARIDFISVEVGLQLVHVLTASMGGVMTAYCMGVKTGSEKYSGNEDKCISV